MRVLWGSWYLFPITQLMVHGHVITGIVTDPHALPIPSAKVVLRCVSASTFSSTDTAGKFILQAETSLPCELEVIAPGFASSLTQIEASGQFNVRLTIGSAPRKAISVSSSGPASSLSFGFESLSLTSKELARYSSNPAEWIGFLQRFSGVRTASQVLFVDGIPATRLPPSEMISQMSIASDSFSVEYHDGDSSQFNVTTKSAERRTRVKLDGTPFGTRSVNALDTEARTESSSATALVSGPLARMPLMYAGRGFLTVTNEEVPIRAVAPPAGPFAGSEIGSKAAVKSTFASASGDLQYSKPEAAFRGLLSLRFLQLSSSNAGAGGISLPESASASNRKVYDWQASIAWRLPAGDLRGGISLSQSDGAVRANSSSRGIHILDNIIAGGPAIVESHGFERSWRTTLLYQSRGRHRNLLTGVAASGAAENRAVSPNDNGTFQFETERDYLNALAGDSTAVRYRLVGNSVVRHSTLGMSPFVQANLMTRESFVIRGGLRVDNQRTLRTYVSPRLSLVAQRRGYIVRSGIGQFVQDISNGIFIKAIGSDEFHLRQEIWRNTPLTGTPTVGQIGRTGAHTRIAADLRRPRLWMAKNSLEKTFAAFTPGLEYTWALGHNNLGSRRLPDGGNWMDLLESNRSSEKHRLHARAFWNWKSHNLSGHYEWTRSVDDGDGAFSFPAHPSSIIRERARSTGVPPHSGSLIGSFQVPAGITLTMIGNWNGSIPYNITSGFDPLGSGLYTDRGDRPRNSGDGPRYGTVSLYGHKRIAIPAKLIHSKSPMFVNFRIHAENLFGTRNLTILGSVASSANFGRALSSMPGRAMRVTFDFE